MSNSEPVLPRSAPSWRERFWHRILDGREPRVRRGLIAATFALVIGIGVADFFTGIQLSLLVFYFVPVALAVAAAGWRFGASIAVACVGIWVASDLAAGAQFSNPLIPAWNALIALVTYLVLIWLLSSVLNLHRDMDERVRQRTAALTEEMAERERLEKAVLEVGERERRSVGRDLHDGLGQHLTGTALVAQALAAQLGQRGAIEAAEARKIVALIEEGIDQTRSVAKGLVLGEIEQAGLAVALRDLTAASAAKFNLQCELRCDLAAELEPDAAAHLYRIAQEALGNAARHGRARRIGVELTENEREITLRITDDGVGLPPPDRRGQGLGLRIMAHRAAMVGARFAIEAAPGGGTIVTCRLPFAADDL